MTSPGKLSPAIVDFVAPLRLWHGLRPPPMVGFVERESGGPASRSALRAFVGRSRENGKRSFRDVQAMFKRVRAPEEREEGEDADAPRLFNCPVWTPPTGG